MASFANLHPHSGPQGQSTHAAVVAPYDTVEELQQERCFTTDLIQSYFDSDFNGFLKTIGLIVLVVALVFTAIGDTLVWNWPHAEMPSLNKERVELFGSQKMSPIAQHFLRRTPAGHVPEEFLSFSPPPETSYGAVAIESDQRADSRHLELLELEPGDDQYLSVEAFSARSRAYDDRMAKASELTDSELLELTRDDELYWSQEAILARAGAYDKQLAKAFRPVAYEAPYRRLELEVTGPEAEYLIELRKALEFASLPELRDYFHAIGSEPPFTQADYSYIEFYLKKAPLEEIKIAVDQISPDPVKQNYRDKMVLKAYREKVRTERRAPKSPAHRRKVESSVAARRRPDTRFLFGQETTVGGKRVLVSQGLNFPVGWGE